MTEKNTEYGGRKGLKYGALASGVLFLLTGCSGVKGVREIPIINKAVVTNYNAVWTRDPSRYYLDISEEELTNPDKYDWTCDSDKGVCVADYKKDDINIVLFSERPETVNDISEREKFLKKGGKLEAITTVGSCPTNKSGVAEVARGYSLYSLPEGYEIIYRREGNNISALVRKKEERKSYSDKGTGTSAGNGGDVTIPSGGPTGPTGGGTHISGGDGVGTGGSGNSSGGPR
jgi:hypothetical protein